MDKIKDILTERAFFLSMRKRNWLEQHSYIVNVRLLKKLHNIDFDPELEFTDECDDER